MKEGIVVAARFGGFGRVSADVLGGD
jgi:hypothetical protein